MGVLTDCIRLIPNDDPRLINTIICTPWGDILILQYTTHRDADAMEWRIAFSLTRTSGASHPGFEVPLTCRLDP